VDDAGKYSSQETSYDVRVRSAVDKFGRGEFGPAVAHFMDCSYAVALKRRLEARGEKVRVERSTVYGLSEAEKEAWFSDYSRIPEFEPAWDRDRPENPAPTQKSSADQSEDPAVAPPPHFHTGAQEASKGSREPWWRRMAGGQ
jgi:hypothetical protein